MKICCVIVCKEECDAANSEEWSDEADVDSWYDGKFFLEKHGENAVYLGQCNNYQVHNLRSYCQETGSQAEEKRYENYSGNKWQESIEHPFKISLDKFQEKIQSNQHCNKDKQECLIANCNTIRFFKNYFGENILGVIEQHICHKEQIIHHVNVDACTTRRLFIMLNILIRCHQDVNVWSGKCVKYPGDHL